MRALALLLLLAPAAAGAECKLDGPAWLEGRIAGGRPATARAIDARIGETIDVFVLARGKLDGRKVVFADDDRAGHVGWSACGPLTVEWRRVEPRMQHDKTPAPNTSAKVYANAVVFGPKHGDWIGYDKLEYFESPLTSTASPRLSVRDARPSSDTGLERDEKLIPLGTMRLTATVSLNGFSVTTPGSSDAPSGQIADRVWRYSFRDSNEFLGWLWSYFNVPYLFGSAGKGPRNQAERRIGGDCADVLVAALRRAGRNLEYSSVAGLVESLTKVSGPAELRTCDTPNCVRPPTALRWGKDIQPGDFLALDYIGSDSLPKAWDHIVAAVEDKGPEGKPDGFLGAEDLVADSGDASALKLAPLGDQGHVRIEVLRAR